MKVKDVLSTVFAFLIFVGLATAGVNRVENPAFREYKTAILAAAAFLVIGVFGLPYVTGDVAQRPPTFEFFFTALAILTFVGIFSVYVFDLPVESYISNISISLIVLTVLSRIWKTDGPPVPAGQDDGFPPLARDFLLFTVIGGTLFGMRKFAMRWLEGGQGHPQIRQIVAGYVGLAPVATWGLLAYAIYRGIEGLIQSRRERITAAGIQKPRAGVAPYESATFSATFSEPFQDATDSLTQRLRAAINNAQNSLDTILEMTDSTCGIIREVEQGYVGSKSAPNGESEFSLPREEQDARRNARQYRAKLIFTKLRNINAASKGATVIECFQGDSGTDDDTIRELCIELATLLENAESAATIAKLDGIFADIEFASKMLERAEKETEGFQDLANDDASAPSGGTQPLDFYAKLSGNELTAAANKLLEKEQDIRNKIASIQPVMMAVNLRIAALNEKAGMVQKGDYNPSREEQSDADSRLRDFESVDVANKQGRAAAAAEGKK